MIRRQALDLLPALAHWFHVMPWDIDPDPPYLTLEELNVFLEALPKGD